MSCSAGSTGDEALVPPMRPGASRFSADFHQHMHCRQFACPLRLGLGLCECPPSVGITPIPSEHIFWAHADGSAPQPPHCGALGCAARRRLAPRRGRRCPGTFIVLQSVSASGRRRGLRTPHSSHAETLRSRCAQPRGALERDGAGLRKRAAPERRLRIPGASLSELGSALRDGRCCAAAAAAPASARAMAA